MDEPTAVLTDAEAEAVLQLARTLARGGRAVVLITHKLRDVAGHADRVTVMRAGRTVLDGVRVAEAPAATLVEAMVGGAMPRKDGRATRPPGAVRLALAGVGRAATGHRMPLADLSLEVRANEILGIAGVGGNGQSELLELLIGLAEPDRGAFAIDGRAVSEGPAGRRRAGLRFVPDDRFRLGLFGDLSIADNLALPRVAGGERLSRRLRAGAAQAIAAYGIAGAAPATPARLLSGGNAQKLMIARELEGPFAVLVAHSPTRGLDVRAVAAVRYRLIEAAWHGAAIVLLSEDLDEVFDLADRVAVLSRGRLSSARPVGQMDRAAVGRLMLGAGE
jgi:simple sugar transport system ATP-binding protein